MAISMQGSWTVSVKSKNAAFAQRFIIEGADSGNGTYAGQVATPPVPVTGAYWSIRIQNNPGTGFIDSDDRIKFPVSVGGQYRFDIESNDAGADEDFNDLILTCSMPQGLGEFLIYGNLSYYSGGCWYNPCYRGWLVIESAAALAEALRYPAVRVPIEKLYPQRVIGPPHPPGPGPDPGPFVPLVLPIGQGTALPARLAQEVRMTTAPAPEASPAKKAKTDSAASESTMATPVRSFAISSPAALAVEIDRIGIGDLVDRLRPLCFTGPLPGFPLRFQEYDRTSAELAGGAYTGTGGRENLGQCVTDRNGNYIFRFSRDLGDFLQEVFQDTAGGENVFVTAFPDVIAQLLDSLAPGGFSYESAPYWNIPNLKRIDLCVPASVVGRPLAGCQGGRVYQQIGFIRVGIPTVSFDPEGRVTCTDNTAPYIPQTSCAAWGGNLRFSACFLDATHASAVTQYTIRHRHRVGMGWSAWQFYQEPLSLQRVGFVMPQQVGPFDRNLQVVAPGPLVPAKAYDNIELNFSWAASDWFTKAGISSGGGSPAYAPTPGPVQFRIQGYDAAGLQVPGKNDLITLYIDNESPLLNIASVGMGAQAGGPCALFHESGEPVPAVLTVRFRAVQNQGFLGRYDLYVLKGNLGNFPITVSSGGFITATPPYVNASPCHQLFGTRPPDEPLAVGDFVTTNIVPAAGNWLDPGQPFCTFVVNVSCTKRVTDGTQPGEYGFGPVQYFLGIEQ